MHDCVKAVGAEQRLKRRGIPNVAFDQRPPAHEVTMAERQIVEYDSLVPGCGECLGTMAAHIAGAAGDKNASHMQDRQLRWRGDWGSRRSRRSIISSAIMVSARSR